MAFIINQPKHYWPDSIIPYTVNRVDFPAGSLGDGYIRDAIQRWNQTCGIKLIPWDDKMKDYAVFEKHSDMCFSSVGRQGGKQSIYCALDSPGFGAASIVHEIGHAAGFYHEHQRPDRDDFVIVDSSVKNDVNYRIPEDGMKIGDYDCHSIMHYHAIQGKIGPKDNGCLTIGSTSGLPTCKDIVAAGIAGISAKQAVLIGINIGRTREQCSHDLVTYKGADGPVVIARGEMKLVSVDPSWTRVDWLCGTNPEDTTFPQGTRRLLVMRSSERFFDVIFLQ